MPTKSAIANRKYREKHPERAKAAQRKWYRKAEVTARYQAWSLMKRYGLTVAEKQGMYDRQGGACEICCRPLPPLMQAHVDHCHSSLIVRGLLCQECNQGLGKFLERPQLLKEAAAYLERYML